jgi:hypothetical protein
MALWFVPRNPKELFFPTAHVHDGIVHPWAPFDHTLFAQGEIARSGWVAGSVLPCDVMNFGNFLISDRTKSTVNPQAPILRSYLQGRFPNQDTRLPTGGSVG